MKEPDMPESWATASPEQIAKDVIETKRAYREDARAPQPEPEPEGQGMEGFIIQLGELEEIMRHPPKPYWDRGQFKKRGRA